MTLAAAAAENGQISVSLPVLLLIAFGPTLAAALLTALGGPVLLEKLKRRHTTHDREREQREAQAVTDREIGRDRLPELREHRRGLVAEWRDMLAAHLSGEAERDVTERLRSSDAQGPTAVLNIASACPRVPTSQTTSRPGPSEPRRSPQAVAYQVRAGH